MRSLGEARNRSHPGKRANMSRRTTGVRHTRPYPGGPTRAAQRSWAAGSVPAQPMTQEGQLQRQTEEDDMGVDLMTFWSIVGALVVAAFWVLWATYRR